jgi:tryptophan-rich hypothetical protein
MNRYNPRKLLNSKWTAVTPVSRERHFMVTEVDFDEQGKLIHCLLEAVLTRRARPIDMDELQNSDLWLQGWK